MSLLLLIAAGVLVVYAAFVVTLIVAGRRPSVRDLARFIPDCIVLVSRLLRDPRVPRRHKLLLGALVGYLALPFDIVPDFIPVAGYLDDVLVVVLTLRAVLRGHRARAAARALAGAGELARATGRSRVALERLGLEDVHDAHGGVRALDAGLDQREVVERHLVEPLGLGAADVARRGPALRIGVLVVLDEGLPVLVSRRLDGFADLRSGVRHVQTVDQRSRIWSAPWSLRWSSAVPLASRTPRRSTSGA